MCHFQKTFDHAGSARQTERAARGLQAGETIHDLSEAPAVKLGDFGQIENDACLLVAENFIEGQLELLALDTHLERAAQFENDDAGLQFFPDDLHGRLSNGCKILKWMAGHSQSESARASGWN